ncbi:MAG: hypothetical protein WC080_03180 [Patescibacteria group bacterium]
MDTMIVELSFEDLDEILEDENLSFPPYLRASRELIEQRLRLGHIMLGARLDGELVGKICFSYSRFYPSDPKAFSRNFGEFSTMPMETSHDCAFVYNLNVQDKYRNARTAVLLAQAMLGRIKSDGCILGIADGRPASYNGSPREGIRQRPAFKEAIDRHLAGGPFPTDRELCLDPLLAFYYRLGGKFLWIAPDFIPEDAATGGLRVIMMKEVEGT